MKKTITKLMLLACFLMYVAMVRGQFADPTINILMQPPSVPLNYSGQLELRLVNAGNSDIVANSLEVTVSVGINAEIIGINGATSDSRWVQHTLTSGTNNTIKLRNIGTLGVAEPSGNSVFLTVKGTVEGPWSTITGNIVYIDALNPLLVDEFGNMLPNVWQGNGQTQNDNSTTSLTVTIELNPDINAGIINRPISGNVNTNDNVRPGTAYGTPIEDVGNPTGATITMNTDGTYSFNATQPGVYSYNVPVCSPGQVMPCPLTSLIITVKNPALNNNPPVVNTDITTTPFNTQVTLPILINDGPGNTGGTLGAPTIVGGANPGATATINASGQLVYTPVSGFQGKDTILYQVCESPSGICKTAMAIITVDGPVVANTTVAADDYYATVAGLPVDGNVKNNDSDPQGHSQTVTAQNITIAGKGTLVLSSTGEFTFTPFAIFTGTVDVPYTTCDNGAPQACTKATLHIVVNAAQNIPLPVRLINFYGTSKDCKTVLKWETAAEINADYFEVEMRTGNGNTFTAIGKVFAQGANASYTFNNSALQSDIAYYRLKMVDKDGKYEYSNIIALRCNGVNAAAVYPNPVKDKLYVSGLKTGINTVTLYSIEGRLMQTTSISTATGYVEMGSLPAGTYMLRIYDSNGSFQFFKVVKQ
jgi:hypothetical protein